MTLGPSESLTCYMAAMRREGALPRTTPAIRPWRGVLVLALIAQTLLAIWGIDAPWTRGHEGWNTAAFHQAARNALRWSTPLPVRYYTGRTPPAPHRLYGHHPLGMHVHHALAMAILGDRRATVRSVAALHGVLVVLALALILRRWWNERVAAVGTWVYVLSPINGIYLHMANHTEGAMTWGLACLAAWLTLLERRESARSVRIPLALWLLCFAMAALWDWTAYYVAFVVLLHALWLGVRRALRARTARAWLREAAIPLLWSVWVLGQFAAHLAWVDWARGSLDDLWHTAASRHAQVAHAQGFLAHLRTNLPIMLGWPWLLVGTGWLLLWPLRLVRGRARHRDVLPLAFATAAVLHYGIFRWSATVHSYWAWPALPFLGIAFAEAFEAAGLFARSLGRRYASLAALGRLPPLRMLLPLASLLLVLTPLAAHVRHLVPAARRVGGAMWFVFDARGHPPAHYDSGQREILFAERVRMRTDRSTGVLLLAPLRRRNPEPRFLIALDREVAWIDRPAQAFEPPERPGIDAWVMLGLASGLTPTWRQALIHTYPYEQCGDLFFVDLRRTTPNPRFGHWRPVSMPWWRRFLSAPYETPLRCFEDERHQRSELEESR